MSDFKSLSKIMPNCIEALKKSESPIEVLMFNSLMYSGDVTLVMDGDKPEGEGVFLLPQAKIGKYRADLYLLVKAYPEGKRIYPPKLEYRCIVECDGAAFHTEEHQVLHDMKRDEYMKSKGIDVYRFTGSEIYKHGDALAKDLVKTIKKKAIGVSYEGIIC